MTEFEIAGKRRGFKLGTYTFKLINKQTGTKTVQEVFDRMKGQDQDFVSAFYFCCAQHWAMSNKEQVDFQEVDVCDWLDDLGLDKVYEITQELFKVYVSKNPAAPTTGLEPSMNGSH